MQVNYYSYLQMKAQHPNSGLGGYTRILHSSQADDIMHLVPTLVVEHLPLGIDRGYGPMHRPWAFSQWLSRANIPEEYIFMSEPDHVFVSPPPLVATPTVPAVFPFFYVDCAAPQWNTDCENPLFNELRVLASEIPRVSALSSYYPVHFRAGRPKRVLHQQVFIHPPASHLLVTERKTVSNDAPLSHVDVWSHMAFLERPSLGLRQAYLAFFAVPFRHIYTSERMLGFASSCRAQDKRLDTLLQLNVRPWHTRYQAHL